MNIADFAQSNYMAGIAFLLFLASPSVKAEQYPTSLLAYQACMADGQDLLVKTAGSPWFSTKYRCVSQQTYLPGIYNMMWVSQTYQTFQDGTVGWGTFHGFEWPYQNVARPEKSTGDCPPCNRAGNPIEIATGNKYQVELDLVGHGDGLDFARYYNSQLSSLRLSTGSLGSAWTHTYERRVEYPVPGSGSLAARVYRADGKVITFFSQGEPTDPWTPSAVEDGDVAERLMQFRDQAGAVIGWRLVSPSPHTYEDYDADGALVGIQRGTISLAVTQASFAGVKRPTVVRASSGRELVLHYRSDGRLLDIVGPGGDQWIFNYNSADLLESATLAGSGRHYLYAETGMVTSTTPAWALTGIVDESATRFATFRYNDIRAISTEHAGGVAKHSISLSNGYAWVTFPSGAQERRQISPSFGVGRVTSVAVSCQNCSAPYTSLTYSQTNGAMQSATVNGVKTTHDIDGLGFDRKTVSAVGTTRQRTIERDRHPEWAVPVERRTYDETGTLVRKELRTYNARGQLLTDSVEGP